MCPICVSYIVDDKEYYQAQHILKHAIKLFYLQISDPPISEIGPSGFVELNSTQQIVALYISQKSNHSIWKTGTSDFSSTYRFPRFDQKPDACCAKLFITIFSLLEICCTVKS
jgi:hypothetical protein